MRSVTYTQNYGDSSINFNYNDQGHLSINIETPRLKIRSVTAEDCDRYAGLFGSKQVMEKYATGETKTKENVVQRIKDVWLKRLRENDPYSGLAVFNKETEEFMGHIVLGHGDLPGESEIAYLFHPQFWGQGYGGEAVGVLVNAFAPATVKQGFLLEGKKLEKIVATTRLDNPASVKILKKLGMQWYKEEVTYGALRQHYQLNLSALQE